MPLTLGKKKEIVKDLEKSLEGTQSIVFVNFKKLKVGDATILRKNLRESAVGYTVAKKTLIKRVLDAKKIEGTQPVLDGELAIAYGVDLIAPAREVYNFQKTHKDNVSILGGVFEGKYMDATAMMSIATIPSLNTLRGMFLNLINSPRQRFVLVLNEKAKLGA